MSERHLPRHAASQVPKHRKDHFRTRSLLGNQSGNVAITFALCLIPTIGAVGVAVDYSRASALRADLQAAVDAAAIAGAQKLNESNRDLKKEVAAFVRSNIPPAYQKLPIDIEIADDRKRLIVKMQGKVDAKFVQLFGIRKIDVGVLSEAVIGVDNTEVVLALDTTGTMRNHIPALQQGAQELLTILFNNARDKNALKVGLVPYVTAVNIGNHPPRMDWMDSNAESRSHGENFENVPLPDRRCDPPPPPPSPTPPPQAGNSGRGSSGGSSGNSGRGGGGSGSSPPPPRPSPPTSPDLGALEGATKVATAPLSRYLDRAVSVLELFAPSAAHAGSWPYGTMDESTPIDCDRRTPARVNHFELFTAMGVQWKGCVEARPGPYDTSDDPPNRNRPDTLFVPYLWPDESDSDGGNIRNNYLPDQANMPSWLKSRSGSLRQSWIWKYNNGPKPNLDDSSFLTRGPNAACPDPIVPLTKSKTTLESAIGKLRAYAASGTNISEGLAWAWRVISPSEPFSEGAPYDKKNKKFIVLMTDGFNEVVPQGVAWNLSDYGSIGYAENARFGTTDRAAITRELDRRLADVCRNIKGKDIQIFTLLFDPVGHTQSSDVEGLLRGCATSRDRHFFKASSRGELVRAFQTIANEITKLRLAR
jgi:hypothetical protein